MTNRAVGIDLGTTFSLAAYVEAGKPIVTKDNEGRSQIPSVIAFHQNGQVHVGSRARLSALSDPANTIFSIKRLMGRKLSDLQQEQKFIPQQIVEREVEGNRKVLCVVIGTNEYTPEELSAMILREVRKIAGNPNKAVITVPAYFDDSQRQATRDAGRIAGMDVLRIINEPTAAALAYGLEKKRDGTIAVYDLGGGTFDCSILSLEEGVFQVLSTHGDTFLGGDDFDRCIMIYYAESLGIQLEECNAFELQYLRDQAEKTKISLTSQEEIICSLVLQDRKLEKKVRVTRSQFEQWLQPFIEKTIAQCQKALNDAKKTADQIDEVVMVGGSTRIPYVVQCVEQFFKRKPHTELNPDEVVALGAAIQADILISGKRDILLLDVVPLSLGIETLGGVVDKIIQRNTPLPARATARYTTFVDNQTGIDIRIYQGERELVQDCRLLGKFRLSGIPPMPAQFAQVEVTFLVDQNGQLQVSAKELRSGQHAAVTIQADHGLTAQEVEQLVLQSIDHAQDDFTRRRFIELRNKADTDLRSAEKATQDLWEMLSDSQRQQIDQLRQQVQLGMAPVLETVTPADVAHLQQVLTDFNYALLPLAEQQMNRVVQSVLRGKSAVEIE